jgi:hypothetical protein
MLDPDSIASRYALAAASSTGARETNVVGGAGGGAWEWAASPAFAEPVGAGVTAMRLAPGGRIAELVFGWDTSRLSSRRYRELPGTGDRA